MSSKKKRTNNPQASSENKDIRNDISGERVSDDGSESDKEAMDTGEVQVEFEARNPEDNDFHGIKKLLQQLFLKAHVNLSELADTLIGQNYVGSVIKQVPPDEDDDVSDDSEDDDDIFGLVTVLNLSTDNPQKQTAANDITAYLLDRCSQCGDAAKEQRVRGLLTRGPAHHVGLIINERFMNIPPQLALPAFESLIKEIERAKKKKMPYGFTHYVLICKMLRMAPIESADQKKKTKQPDRQTWDTVYVNAEEEYFAEEAEVTLDYSVRDERDLGSESDDMEPWRRVLIFSAEKLPVVMSKLRQDLSQS